MFRRNPDVLAVTIVVLALGVISTVSSATHFLASNFSEASAQRFERKVELLGQRFEEKASRIERRAQAIAERVEAASKRAERIGKVWE
jgi:sensor domain CHASE-containing protein